MNIAYGPVVKGFTSKIVHSDRQQAIEHGAVHKPVHDSVAFSFEDARELAAVFQGKQPGYTYGRQVNPTVSALENKITAMERGRQCLFRYRHGGDWHHYVCAAASG